MKNLNLTQKDLVKLTLSEHEDISMYLASGAKVNILELITMCNYRAKQIHKSFKFVVIFDYNHEGFDTLRGRSSSEFTIEYTQGGMFKLYGAGEEHQHPVLSIAALKLFRNCVKKDKLLLDEEIILFSDEIRIFNEVNTGMLTRYPRDFWAMMSDQHYHALCKYFIEFCCGFNKFTVIEMKMHHVIKWKATHIIKYFSSMYNMATVVAPELEPWDMLFVSQGTYQDSHTRYRAISHCMRTYDIIDPQLLKNTMLVSQGMGGLVGYYINKPVRGIKGVRAEYVATLNGGITND